MMSTTDYPVARQVALTLDEASRVLLTQWEPKGRGVPEVIASLTEHDSLTRIIAERALVEGGIDVWWNDLLCRDRAHASQAVGLVASEGVDLEVLYGPNFDAIVGILRAVVLMDSAQISAAAAQLPGDSFHRLYDLAFEAARGWGVERLMDRTLSDVLFACQKGMVTTPAGVERLLHGARVFELAAAFYILDGAGSVLPELLEPIKRALWPHFPNLKGGAS